MTPAHELADLAERITALERDMESEAHVLTVALDLITTQRQALEAIAATAREAL